MGKIADCVSLSIVWIMFCLPGFTAGAATTALYYTVVKVLRRDEGSAIKEFWKAFKSNFKQSTIAFVLAFLLCVVWGLVCLAIFSGTAAENQTSIYAAYFFVLALLVMWLHYVFSYIGRFEDKFGTILKNTLIICIANFPYSLLVVTMLVAVILVIAFALPNSLWALLIVPALYMLCVSLILEPVYQKYLPAAEEND